MLRPWVAHWVAAVLACRAVAQYSSDQCSWRGSGLSHEAHRRDVEQVYLRCSEGSLEWLYPTGAIIVNLRPNTEPPSGLHVCIKPHVHSQGSHVYLERAGDLRLLLADQDHARGEVRCFMLGEGALFVEAVPQTDISRRITAFQYELVPSRGPGAHMYPYLHPASAACKPCSDEEVLMAVCTSDFAGSGVFGGVAPGPDERSPTAVTLTRLFHQKSRIFSWGGARGRRWSGRVFVPERCGVRQGDGEFLLTGSVHFGEAWLGCAPRYKDFQNLYVRAQQAGANPCQIDTSGEISAQRLVE
ncbi:meteorin-like protein [Salarias fasciatus]|uniref:Meteorin-like protein n=1 Tax=Salarias fasciatus TaxID=181472 RepID=A0A672HAX4_SALFA|nr:meteorin-like protein [Salarias fasciatus]